jgi:hypothetical protein
MQGCTGRYQAVGDDGRSYTVEVWTHFAGPAYFQDPGVELPLLKTLQTSDGDKLNYIGKGHYQLVKGGVLLRSDDPDAP